MSPPPPAGLPPLRVFFALSKARVVELWLGFFVAFSLLGRGHLSDGRSLAILGASLLLGVLTSALACCLDDIAGARDGVDRANHAGKPRWGVSKPLLDGSLSEAQALTFTRWTAAAVVACLAAVLALAWPIPGWLLALAAGVLLASINYSAGLKLSYHGAGELVVFTAGLGTVLVPFALVTGTVTRPAVVCAALLGGWQAQIVMCSNAHDAAGDRATGRLTIAARTSPAGNRAFVTSMFVTGWTLTAAALSTGAAPLLYTVALLPVWGMQGAQLWMGACEGRWLDARRMGFRALRAGVFALTLANLLRG